MRRYPPFRIGFRGSILQLFLLFPWIIRTPAEDILRHRAFFGMSYRALSEEEVEKLSMPDSGGLMVRSVMPGMSADRAGIKAGDILLRFNRRAVTGLSDFPLLLQSFYAGDQICIELWREGRALSVQVQATSRPEEKNSGVATEYTSFLSKGTRLRAVLVSPEQSEGQKLPALLLTSALISPQLIAADFYSPTRNLAVALAQKGYRVLRFELRGYGDSEGNDYREGGFHSEVEDNLAAFDYLQSRSDVKPQQVFLYGHSTGGMEAAIIAGRRSLAGLIVSCTIGRTFWERMTDTLRVQGSLSGKAPVDIDRTIQDHVLFCAAIAQGDTQEEILKRRPDFVSFFSSSGRIMDDRNLLFWREQLSLNLGEIYNRVRNPVLILYAEQDYLTQRACHERLREVLQKANNLDVQWVILPETDHAYAFAADKKTSYENRKTQNWKENPLASKKILEWLQSHCR